MRTAIRRIGRRPGALWGMTLVGLLLAGAGQADDEQSSVDVIADPPRSIVATSPAGNQLNLLLTRAELQAIVRNYEVKTGEVHTSPIDEDEVIVTAPYDLAPMRDVSQDLPGPIVAPFWAVMHPKDAWRIFVPIPPRERTQEAERPAPDPR